MFPGILFLLALATKVSSHMRINDLTRRSDDLERFVSRPDLRPPKFSVDLINESAISEGYWFVAPYADLLQRPLSSLHQPHQIGPHIYDNHGHLIWSGGDLFPGRNVFDFKVMDDSDNQLTFILGQQSHDKKHSGGVGVLLNNAYQIDHLVHAKGGSRTMNMHEFTVLKGGKTALTFVHQEKFFETEEPEFHAWIIDLGFIEIDVYSGEVLFEWWAAEHVHPLQSTVLRPRSMDNSPWDFFHIDSVDQDENGDYLVSARHTNTIYKISRIDKSIIWQLGGANSSFVQDFYFSSQHHARFESQNETTTVISFLNNASDGKTSSANTSSAMLVALETSNKKNLKSATLLRKLDRPDHKLTKLRGNVQTLPNGNIFIGWSENSCMSEFTNNGRLVLQAQFASERFVTSRSFKYNFTGNPLLPPDLACFAYGTATLSTTTACYVSWNGATEVKSWNFYSTQTKTKTSDGDTTFLGNIGKHGFETILNFNGYFPEVFAEALDAQGRSLRNSTIKTTKAEFDLTIINDEGAPAPAEISLVPLSLDRVSSGSTLARGFNSWKSLGIGAVLGAFGSLAVANILKLLQSRSHQRKHGKWYIQYTDEL